MEHYERVCQRDQEHQHQHSAGQRQTRAEKPNKGRKGQKQHNMEEQLQWQRAEENLKVQS